MGTFRFRLKHRVTTIIRHVFPLHRSRPRYTRLGRSNKPISMTRFFNWTNSLKNKAKDICSKRLGSGPDPGPGRGYMHMEQESPVPVPKGYVTVYVGQKDGDFERVFVPVFYFKHPLFCELLKEAEEEFGYDHPGGITLPCPLSEFENVQTRIKCNRVTRKMFMRK